MKLKHLSLLLLSLTWALSATARPGMGFYIEQSAANKGEVKYVDSDSRRSYGEGAIPEDAKFDTRNDKFSAGFALATGVFDNSLFSYRLNVGLSYSDMTFKDGNEHTNYTKDKKFKMASFLSNHDFVFNLNRGDKHKVWLGPSVHTHIGSAENRKNKKETMAIVGIGAGPVVALDFVNTASVLTLKLGARYVAYAGAIDEDRLKDEYLLQLYSREVYFNISALF